MTAAEEAIGARQPRLDEPLAASTRRHVLDGSKRLQLPDAEPSDGVSTLGEQRAKHESRTERIRKRLAQIEARDEATRQSTRRRRRCRAAGGSCCGPKGLLGELGSERVLGGAGPPVELSIVGPPVGLSSVEVFPR